MKLAIIGGRDFNDYEKLVSSLADIEGVKLVISGGAKGADALAERYAKEKDIEFIKFLPDWNIHGKAAGPIRNELIIKTCDRVVAFWDGKSPGTRSSIELAKKYRKRYRIVGY